MVLGINSIILEINMSEFFQGLNLTTSLQKLEENFIEVDYTGVTSGQGPVCRKKLRAVYLYTSAPKNPMTRHFAAKRPGSSYIRPRETKDVNAFYAFGRPGTPHVLVMFQDTAQETQNFLKFSLHIRPGDEV